MNQNVNELGATQTLDNVLAAIFRQADAGAMPNREEWLTRYPQFADALREFFADEERVGRWTAPLREAAASTRTEAVTVGAESDAAVAPVGRTFGDYEILEEIGQGGMGIVYRARQQRLNRLVALKMVRAGEFASEADRLRFHNEAEVVGRMDHPHIVPIYEVGEAQGQHFFSMKLVEGPSLAGWIADCRSQIAGLAIDEQAGIARLVATVARAVHHAHQRGILHRDLKPANILLVTAKHGRDGESTICHLQSAIPMVTDFGLAKRVEETPSGPGADGAAARDRITQSGAIVGTPGYMAPEQAGAGKGLSTAVDTYSLGAIFYELLTGRPPFQAATALDTLLLVLHEEPVHPKKVNPRIDGDLETICLKCLEKDPQRRYGSAEELAKDLERWLAREPIKARRAGKAERLAKWSRRRPAAAAALAITMFSGAALITLAGFLWQNAEARAAAVKSLDEAESKIAQVDGELQRKTQDIEQKKRDIQDKNRAIQLKNEEINDKGKELVRLQKLAQEEGARAEQARERGDGILYDADMQFAHAAWQNDDVPGMLRLLENHRPKAGQRDRRGFEWRYLWRLAQGDGFTLLAHSARDRALSAPLDKVVGDIPSASFHPVLLALSPNGKVLASTGGDQKIKLWHAHTGKPIRAFPGPKAVSLGFARDGKSLILVTVRPAEKGQMPFPALPGALAGKASLKGLNAGLVMRALNLEGEELEKPTAFDPVRWGGSIRADGAAPPVNIMAAPREGMAAMVGAMIALDGRELFGPMCLAVDRDKKTLALGGVVSSIPSAADLAKFGGVKQEGALLLWDLATQRPKKLFKGESSMVMAVAFSPDGGTLASAAFDRTVKVRDPVTFKQRALLKGQATPVSALGFSAKGTRVIAGALDGVVKVWDLGNDQAPLTFKGLQNSISSVCISADDEMVLAGCVDGTIRSWNARKPTPHQFVTNVLDLAFASDGKHLAGLDRNGALKRIDLGSGKEDEIKIPMSARLRPAAVFAPGGETVIVIDRDRSLVKTFDVLSSQERFSSQIEFLLSAACLSPDGKMLALACSDKRAVWRIQLWNTSTAKLERTLQGGAGMVRCLAFAPDGKTLASGGTDRTVRIWDALTGQVRQIMTGNAPASGLAFAPSGKHLAVAEGGNVRLLEVATGKELLVLPGSLAVLSMSFSPGGRRLATGGGDAELGRGFGVKLWDMTTGREVLSLGRPTQVVSHVAFSPDGNHLAAALSGDTSSGPIYNIARPAEVKFWSAAR